jgi:ATP-dependent Zn protease
MTPSVYIAETTQDRLQRLREEITLETGQKVTQEDLLERIVEQSYEARRTLIDSYRDEWEGLAETSLPSDTVEAVDDEQSDSMLD